MPASSRYVAPARMFVETFAFSAGMTLGLFAPIVALCVIAWAVDRIEEHQREVSATQA